MSSCSDAAQLARGDRGADARPADEDAAVGLARTDRLADLLRLVGVVDPHRRIVGAEIDRVVSQRRDRRDDRASQLRAPVVERDGDAHTSTLPLHRFVDSTA